MSETRTSARGVEARQISSSAGSSAVLLIGAVIVLMLRSFQAHALETSTALHAKQYVTTIEPKAAGDGQPLTLPGTLLGVIESTVYARSNGYVVRWVKDIGSPVKKGELMAEITAPGDQPGIVAGDLGARASAASVSSGEKHRRSLAEPCGKRTQ